jgi:Na+:H+ antiporter, NhaA family
LTAPMPPDLPPRVPTGVPRLIPEPDPTESRFLGTLFEREALGGLLALGAAAIAVAWANLAGESYDAFGAIRVGPLDLRHWAADGALAVFFFVAGLEVKREFVVGSLRRPADALVPVAAAVMGVVLPSLLFLAANLGGSAARGWAIPAATDIAFALAVLAVVGSNLPASLRAFLLTLAVVDDLIVIAIIAVFYTETLQVSSLLVALALFLAYGVAQRLRVRSPLVYLPIALASWWFLYLSGVHATIAGVVLGLLTRVLRDPGEEIGPAERLEHRFSPISSFVAVPVFALMSAGVALAAPGELVSSPIAIGVIAGLVLGKPVGVLLGAWIAARFTLAELNADLSWRDVVGVALLAGIGFTVSLLVSDLALSGTSQDLAKAAVLIGSVTSAVLGALVLSHRDRFHSFG